MRKMVSISHWGMFGSEKIAEAGSPEAKLKHGRSGAKNSRAKLSEAQILRIKADPRTGSEIAGTYNISQAHVSRIKNGFRSGKPGARAQTA